MRGIMLTFWAIACSDPPVEPDDTDTDEQPGACGDVSAIDVAIAGGVRDADQQPVPGAHVVLEERNWAPGTVHGEADADSNGRFAFTATELPVVEGCWGVAVQFYLVGETGELSGEKPMNQSIIGAYTDGTLNVELGEFPLILQ